VESDWGGHPVTPIKNPKRSDLVAEQVKRLITARSLLPGDKLPKESELQRLFSVSKATAREALKSLEVQGLVTINTGPNGGATVAEVPLGRAFQLVQNYLFFKDVDIDSIYAVRRIVEPELAAGAVPHLRKAEFEALERSIEICAPVSDDRAVALEQRQEDLHFHDILAAANPNEFLRFITQMINEMLRQMVVFGSSPSRQIYQKFGADNVAAHRAILEAARAKDSEAVRRLMLAHIVEAEGHVRKLHGEMESKLVLDSDASLRLTPRRRTKQ
jgi:DNA-binding FadR family transcriptional regulator